FAKTGGAGTVDGLGSATASSGVATKTVTGHTAGSITIGASATGLLGDSTTFTVTAGEASQVLLAGSSTDLAFADGRDYTATVKDAAGNVVTDFGGTVTFSQSGTGSVAFTGGATASPLAGVATKSVTGLMLGSVTLKASITFNSL